MDWLVDTLKLHGPWGVAVMLAVVLFKKHVEENKEDQKRITKLEQTSVMKDDFQRLETRFESHAREMRDGQTQILTMLAERNNDAR